MVTFNELLITDDRKQLVVGCCMDDLNIYDGMYIKSIYIDYYKNSEEFGVPSSKAYKIFDNSEDDPEVKMVRVCVDSESLPPDFGVNTFKDGIFYVIVSCDGTIPSSVSQLSCGMDDTVDVGIAIDWKTLYDIGMQYVAKMSSKCFDPCDADSGFNLFIMQWNALKLALSACEYKQMELIWDKILLVSNKLSLETRSTGCGCR